MRTLGRLLHPGRHGEVCKVLRGAALRLRDAHLEAGTVQVQDSVRVRLSRRPLPRVRRSAARTRTVFKVKRSAVEDKRLNVYKKNGEMVHPRQRKVIKVKMKKFLHPPCSAKPSFRCRAAVRTTCNMKLQGQKVSVKNKRLTIYKKKTAMNVNLRFLVNEQPLSRKVKCESSKVKRSGLFGSPA